MSHRFNPRPPLRVGATLESPRTAQQALRGTFQSSPTAEGGRDVSGMRCQAANERRFNPRPPLRVGADVNSTSMLARSLAG